jgi:L-lactate dehydrogenase complex protein LldG
MSERAAILTRIKEALRLSSPKPGHAHPQEPASNGGAEHHHTQGASAWLPAVGESWDEQMAMFREQAAELRAEFQLLSNWDEVRGALHALAQADGWKMIATHRGEMTDFACAHLNLPTVRTEVSYHPNDMERCDVGITECDALVAQTGSVIISTRSAGGRALSVLPPHHVVLARRDQLKRDLPAAFAFLKEKYAENYPSFLSVVTGPSRTGDIERILVLGAHGPKRLTILCG